MNVRFKERPVKVKRHLDSRILTGPEVDDARALALELAGLRDSAPIDAMSQGLVLESDELARRVAALWLRIRVDGQWSPANWSQVLISDHRLLVRLSGGDLVSLWWGSLVGFEVNLGEDYVILDFGDGRPRALSGAGVVLVAVAGVARLYGVEALTTHPALEPLRAG
jgi:hypothetical protein